MKIVFNRQQILSAVAPLMCAVSGRATLSAIEGILIEAQDGICTLTTFDLEKGMKTEVECDVYEGGSFIINAQKFYQTLKVMDGSEIELTIDQKSVANIVCGKSSHKMSALLGSDFPEIPSLKSEKGFTVSQSVLKRMMSKVMYAMGVNDQRPVLNGCHFKITEDEILLVSCDSFKLAKCSAKAQIENNNTDASGVNFSFIIPSKTMIELYKLLNDNDSTVRVYMSRKNIVFSLGETVFFSRLIDGEYIDYERIIIKNHRIVTTMNKNSLIAALERAALVTEERIAGSVRCHVKLDFDADTLKISATSTAGSIYDEVIIGHDGDGIIIAFNNRYLIDSLRACSSEMVKISLTSPLSSINIEALGDDEDEKELFMLLPVRMKE